MKSDAPCLLAFATGVLLLVGAVNGSLAATAGLATESLPFITMWGSAGRYPHFLVQ